MNRLSRHFFMIGAALLANAAVPSTHAQAVYSNIVGFHRTEVPSNGVAFISSGFVTPSNTLDEVVGVQAVVPLQDSVRTWDGSSYSKYVLFPPIADPRSNTWVSAQTFQSADVMFTRGSGVIFENTQASGQQVIIGGDVVTNDSITVTISNGIHLVSYPFSSDLALNSSTLTNAASAGDQIFTFDAATQAYSKFVYFGDIPGDPLRSFKWLSATTFLPTDYLMKVGVSFFYENVNPAAVIWTEDRKY